MKADKLPCEMTPKERIALEFKKNSMLYRFYLWLFKKRPETKQNNEN